MSRRAGMAALVLALWLAGMATLAHREIMRDPEKQLALAGLLVTPGADFHAVHRDGEHIGFTSVTVDTAETGIAIIEYTVFDLPRANGESIRMARRIRSEATRGLKLVRFRIDEQAGSALRTVIGDVEGDTVLVLTVSDTSTSERSERVKLDHPVLPSSAVTFALALSRSPRAGRSYDFITIDPIELRPVTQRLRVVADSTLVVADSAVIGREGRWVPARADTVRAWRVQDETRGRTDMWVDVSGRLVSRRYETGISEHRTAYEIAHLNWPGSRFRQAVDLGTTRNEPTP